MKKRMIACLGVVLAALFSASPSSAALIAHWELEETNLTEYTGGVYGQVLGGGWTIQLHRQRDQSIRPRRRRCAGVSF